MKQQSVNEVQGVIESIDEAQVRATLENEYRALKVDYSCGMRNVIAKIENIKEQMTLVGTHPISFDVDNRIKAFDSVWEKCIQRRYVNEGQTPNIDIVKNRVKDIAGIRIVTMFTDDVYTIRDEILRQPGIVWLSEKDYIKEPKPNGYRSLHLEVQNEIFSIRDGKNIMVPIEIQIRDMFQDLWSKVEHHLNYKEQDKSPEIVARFKQMADDLMISSESAIDIRDDRSRKPRKKKR